MHLMSVKWQVLRKQEKKREEKYIFKNMLIYLRCDFENEIDEKKKERERVN